MDNSFTDTRASNPWSILDAVTRMKCARLSSKIRYLRSLSSWPTTRTITTGNLPPELTRQTCGGKSAEPLRTVSQQHSSWRREHPISVNTTGPARYPYVPDPSDRRAPDTTAPVMSPVPVIEGVHHPKSGTWQYIVADPDTLTAVIIDPVLDFDPVTQAISTATADCLLAAALGKGYKIDRILETHTHADHLTAASYLQDAIARVQGERPRICIGRRFVDVQHRFGLKYSVPNAELESAFDELLDDDEKFAIGNLEATTIHLPGHTPDHVGYLIGQNVFCGDSLFIADLGTARCDFPGGSAKDLYQSTRKLLQLPDHYKIWTGHDYPHADRKDALAFMTVEEQRNKNRYLHDAISETAFQTMRQERDATLNEPKLLHASLQVNIRGGRLPGPSAQGERFLQLPLHVNGAQW